MPNYKRRIQGYTDTELRTAHAHETWYLSYLMTIDRVRYREFRRQTKRNIRVLNAEMAKRAKKKS